MTGRDTGQSCPAEGRQFLGSRGGSGTHAHERRGNTAPLIPLMLEVSVDEDSSLSSSLNRQPNGSNRHLIFIFDRSTREIWKGSVYGTRHDTQYTTVCLISGRGEGDWRNELSVR